MNPRICQVVGANDVTRCGVRDYAAQLKSALENIGLSVEVLAPSDWSLKSFVPFCSELRRRQFDIVHIQYPSIGNRKSLCPQILGKMGVAKGVVVTVHEYSSLPALQRASMHLFRWTADQLLFTTSTESESYGQLLTAHRIITIGSNIPAFPSTLPRTPTVLYFGQVRPQKGLEDFLELAKTSAQLSKSFKFQVIGSVPPRRAAYYKFLRENSIPAVEWLLDLPSERVAFHMASSLAAYLPYPDGATYRRSSLLAALTNGLPSITTASSATPRDFSEVLLFASGIGEALAHLERLLKSPAEAQALGLAGKSFVEKFSWMEIAQQHVDVYSKALVRGQATPADGPLTTVGPNRRAAD